MKKYLIGFIIGALVFGTSVYAVTSYIYSSNEVSYTPSDSSWSVGNVKEALDNLKTTSGTALTDLKNTSIAKAVSANGNSLSSVINTLGGISNKGDLTKTINPGGSVSIAAGYYSGGKITANANQNSGTYTPTSRSSSLDMGANNTYRYVNTNSVPNTNSETYTPSAHGTALDMGVNNTYRYVNTTNVWNQAVAAADARTNTASANYKAGYNAGVTAGSGSAFEVWYIGPRMLNQEDSSYVYKYDGLHSGRTTVGSQHGRGGPYTISGNYANYSLIDDGNAIFRITLKTRAYVNGVAKASGSYIDISGYWNGPYIVVPY